MSPTNAETTVPQVDLQNEATFPQLPNPPKASADVNIEGSQNKSDQATNPDTPVPSRITGESQGAQETAITEENAETIPITAERTYHEAEIVLTTSLSRKYQEIKGKKNTTHKDRAISTLYGLFYFKQNPGKQLQDPYSFQSDGRKLRISPNKNGKRVAMDDNKGNIITTIVRNESRDDGVYFLCAIEDGDSLVEVHVDELIRAQMFAESALLEEAFEEEVNTKSLMTAYIQANTSGKKEISDQSLPERAANEAHIPTANDFRRLIVSSQENTIIDSSTSADLLARLDGTTLVDQHTAGEILATLNTTDIKLGKKTKEIEDKKAELETMKTGIDAMPDGSAKEQLTAQYDALLGDVAILEAEQKDLQGISAAIAALPGGAETAMINLLTPLYDGSMDPHQAQEFLSALEKGNADEMLKKLLGELPDDHPDKSKFMKMAEQAARVGIPAVGILLALLIISGAGGARGG